MARWEISFFPEGRGPRSGGGWLVQFQLFKDLTCTANEIRLFALFIASLLSTIFTAKKSRYTQLVHLLFFSFFSVSYKSVIFITLLYGFL